MHACDSNHRCDGGGGLKNTGFKSSDTPGWQCFDSSKRITNRIRIRYTQLRAVFFYINYICMLCVTGRPSSVLWYCQMMLTTHAQIYVKRMCFLSALDIGVQSAVRKIQKPHPPTCPSVAPNVCLSSVCVCVFSPIVCTFHFRIAYATISIRLDGARHRALAIGIWPFSANLTTWTRRLPRNKAHRVKTGTYFCPSSVRRPKQSYRTVLQWTQREREQFLCVCAYPPECSVWLLRLLRWCHSNHSECFPRKSAIVSDRSKTKKNEKCSSIQRIPKWVESYLTNGHSLRKKLYKSQTNSIRKFGAKLLF